MKSQVKPVEPYRANLLLERSLVIRAKVQAASEGKTLARLVTTAIEAYLNKNNQKVEEVKVGANQKQVTFTSTATIPVDHNFSGR